MTVTDDDRRAAETLADRICGCANRDQHRADVAAVLAYGAQAFAAGRLTGLEEAAGIIKAYDTFDNDVVISANRAAVAIDLGDAIRALKEKASV